MSDELQNLRNDNMERFRRLAEQGMVFESALMLQLRLESVIEILYPADTPEREAYELAFEEKMSSIILEAEQQALRAKLMQGVSGNGHSPLRLT